MAVDQETLTAVKDLLNEKLAPGASAATGFGQLGVPLQGPQAFSPAGISFRIKIQLPNGSEVSPYLHFGPEHCSSADAILTTIQNLMNMGIPIDTFTPRHQQQGNWGGGGGYNQGGSGYQGGGGYNRGGGGGFNRGGRW